MRRARIRITPSLPARRAPSATAKAAAPTKPIDELKDDAKPEDDEKIVQIGKSSESLNEIQTRDKNDETVKIEKSSPSKLPKPTHNTPEFEQKKQEEPNLNDAFKTPEVHSKSVEESSDGSGTTQPVAGVPAKSRSRVKIMPHLKATRNISSLKPATSLEPENPILPVFEESVKEIRPETPVFAPLGGMASPPPCHTPQPPPSPAPFSPFALPYPHPHPRIRTESLCSMKSNFSAYKDMGGVVRKNFRSEETQRIIDTKRESRMRLSNKDLDKTQLRMFDMIYWNPTTSPMKAPVNNPDAKRMERSKSVSSIATLEADDEDLDRPATFVVPQLMFGPNGEMILDEKSLVIENEQQKQNRILLASSNVVYDDELSGNYGYYKRQKRTRDWSAEETVKFYRCLQTVGTDFSLMLTLFTDTNRTRRDLKLKFKKEERSNLALINKALMHPNSFDIDELKRELEAEENAKKLVAENKAKNEVHERLKKEILKKHEAKKVKLSQKRKASQVELILNEQPNEESSLPATSETKENQQQVRTSKRRKVKEEPTPVQLIKVATNEKKIIEVPEIKPEIRISVKKSPVKEPVIQEIISKKTEEILDLDTNKHPSPIKSAPTKLPAFGLLKSPPHIANFETFVDQQGNRFECELRNVADPPLLIEYTGDTFKIKLTKDLAQKDEENFKVSEKQDWTPEVDYSKISVQDLQVVMDVDEAGPAKEVELSSNIVSQNVDPIPPIPPISKEAGTKMIVDQEENLPSSLSEIVAVPETMDVQATTSCDQQNTQIIFPKKELKTRPAILIDNSDIEIPQIPEKSVVLAVESSEIESPVYVGVSDNDYFQPKFETKEETTEDQGNLDDYPVEPEVQPSQSQEFCEPQQEQYQEYYENPEPYCEDQPVLEVQTEIQENDPEIEQEDDQEEPSMMDAISEFVNNFDLSSLVLIETEVNGKTVQEVHTMDPETEEVSSEPIDCPQAIKDYLIKHMQGGEDSDDDEEEDE